MSTATAVRGPIIKFDRNVPVRIDDAKYLDLVGGQYGPQVRVKGTINGQENAIAYLPGHVADVLTNLLVAGVILEAPAHYPDNDDRRGFALQRGETRSFSVTLSEVGGEKDTLIDVGGAAPVAAPAPQPPRAVSPKPAPAAPAPRPAAPTTAPSPVPDMDAINTKRGNIATVQYFALRSVCTELLPVFREQGIEPDADTVHKLAFELFKTWCDRGLV